jgi:hypothetical protein
MPIRAPFSSRVAEPDRPIPSCSSKFADLVKVGTSKDDSTVDGMGEAMEKLVLRYPWLADADGPSDVDVELPAPRSASPPKKQRDKAARPDRKAMESRLPALRRHSR